MVHVGIPQLGFQAMIVLVIGLKVRGGHAQEQVVARPVGYGIRQGAPSGTYMFMDAGQRGAPTYAILDGASGMTPETAGIHYGRGLSGGESAFIFDVPGPRAADIERSTSFQVVQAPSQQSVQQLAQAAVRAVPARMMRPAIANPPPPVQAVQAPVQVSVQRGAPVSPAPLNVASARAPVIQAQAYQAPVQRSAQLLPPAPPSEVARAAPAPVRAYQLPVQRSRQSITAPNPAPARANQPARQPAPVLIRAPPDSDARVTIAQAIPTRQMQTFISSIAGVVTQTGAANSPTNVASPTNTASPVDIATRTANKPTTTTNGRRTITPNRTTPMPSPMLGSAVSGRPDLMLIAMVLGFAGIEVFLL